MSVALPWGGASATIAYWNLPFTTPFTFTERQIANLTFNFTLAVRWNDEDGVVVRRVLYRHPASILAYPAYAGEPILPPARLEAWSAQGVTAELTSATLRTGILESLLSAADIGTTYTLVACNPTVEAAADLSDMLLTCVPPT